MANSTTLAPEKTVREAVNTNLPKPSHSMSNTATPTAAEHAPELQKGSNRKKIILPLIALVVLSLAIYGVRTYMESLNYEETDNAQVDANIYPIASKVAGQVQTVHVKDNQRVQAGDALVTLDPADYEVRKDIASAALENAQGAILTTKTNSAVAESNAEVIAANAGKINTDLQRSTNLRQQDVISQSEYDAIKASADALAAQYNSAKGQVKTTFSQLPAQQANVKMRLADLHNAELQLSYTTMKAPAAGYVTRKNVQRGQILQPGQSIMSVVGSDDLWVTANFKETQIGSIREGQDVKVTADAYPGVEFSGKVASIAAGTGAKFSLLPPDNASGNFVKVTQRIPVKITVTPKSDKPLRAGMNVEVAVRVK